MRRVPKPKQPLAEGQDEDSDDGGALLVRRSTAEDLAPRSPPSALRRKPRGHVGQRRGTSYHSSDEDYYVSQNDHRLRSP